MSQQLQLLLEAEKRGLLDDRNAAMLSEARRRGIVPHADPHVQPTQTREGDTVPVFRVKAKKVAGYTGKKPQLGESIRQPPVEHRSGASLKSQLKASITSDPDAKARLYARARGEQMERYRTLEDGTVMRRGDDGVFYPEESEATSGRAKTMLAKAPRFLARTGAEGAAFAMGGPLAAGATAALMEAGERKTAKATVGERADDPVMDYVIRPTIQGGTALATGYGAKLLSKVGVVAANKAARGAGQTGYAGKLVKGTENVDRTGIKAKGARFERFDIPTSTGRTTGSTTLQSVERDLGTMPGPAGDVIRAGEKQTQKSVVAALRKGKGGLPKTDVLPAEAGKTLVGASDDILTSLTKQRRSQAKRLYSRAFQEAAGTPIQTAEPVGLVQSAIKSAPSEQQRKVLREVYDSLVPSRAIVGRGGKRMTERLKPITDIAQLDKVQKMIKTKAKQAADAHEGDLAQTLYDVRDKLINSMSKVSPAYKAATESYKHSSRAIEAFEGEFRRKLVRAQGDYAHKAPGILFGKESSPQLVRKVKSQIINSSKEGHKKWNAISRGALTDVMGDLGKTLKIPQWKMDIMQTTLSSKKFKALQEFQKALGDISAQPFASGAGAAGGKEVLEREVGGIAPRVLKRATLSPYIQSKEWASTRVSKNAEAIARELASNKGARNILRLKQFKPGSEKWLSIMTYLLGAPQAKQAVGRLVEGE